MKIIKFLVTVMIAALIVILINKKYDFRSKYGKHSNKHIKFFIIIAKLIAIIMVIFIEYSFDDFFKSIDANGALLSSMIEIPLLSFYLVFESIDE